MEKKYIFIGPAGSGKTTLINMLLKDKKFEVFDIIKVMKPYIEKYGFVTNKNKKVLDEVVDEFTKQLMNKNFDILEFATGLYLTQILKALRDNDVTVVYCKCSKRICVDRLVKRRRKIPQHYLDYQFKFGSSYYKKLNKRFNFKLVILDTSDTKKAYLILKRILI
ncbi:AAA family ATPase [Candidatus Pacearchaeota archaeon]|nr:AAA family ATPase [Candidatus Pacearchaeota archaeon]